MPLSCWEGQYFICIGRLKYVGDLKKYDFYGIILLSQECGWLLSVAVIEGSAYFHVCWRVPDSTRLKKGQNCVKFI